MGGSVTWSYARVVVSTEFYIEDIVSRIKNMTMSIRVDDG